MAKIFNANTFEEALKAPIAVIDFYADWCGPCKMMAPVFDEFAEEVAGKAVAGKVNVDQNPELAQKYGVVSIPTLVVLKDGEAAKKFVGVTDLDTLLDAVEALA